MGSLPFVSLCTDPHRDGERIRMASAPDSDTRVIPTCVGKLGIDSFVAFVISGHPHLRGEISGCGFDGSTGLVGV